MNGLAIATDLDRLDRRRSPGLAAARRRGKRQDGTQAFLELASRIGGAAGARRIHLDAGVDLGGQRDGKVKVSVS